MLKAARPEQPTLRVKLTYFSPHPCTPMADAPMAAHPFDADALHAALPRGAITIGPGSLPVAQWRALFHKIWFRGEVRECDTAGKQLPPRRKTHVQLP
jgi:hypothetical protein